MQKPGGPNNAPFRLFEAPIVWTVLFRSLTAPAGAFCGKIVVLLAGDRKPGKDAEAGDAAASSMQADTARRSRKHQEGDKISANCFNNLL